MHNARCKGDGVRADPLQRLHTRHHLGELLKDGNRPEVINKWPFSFPPLSLSSLKSICWNLVFSAPPLPPFPPSTHT